MAKRKRPKVPISERRGVVNGGGNSWEMTLVQVPGRPGPVDLDEVLGRLIEGGVVGESRRDVGADIHAKRIGVPAGNWGLLVSLPAQSWAYLLTSFLDYDFPAEIARRSGLRSIFAAYQDTADATGFDCFEGGQALVRFESCGMGEEEPDEEEGEEAEPVFGQTRFTGSRFPANWHRQFQDEVKVQDALARDFDAYVLQIGAGGHWDNLVAIHGSDRGKFRAEDYLRIDLLGFGDARLEPSAADFQLRDALEAGDLGAIRAAVAAGADLRRLPGSSASALRRALGARRLGGTLRRDLAATLLELGADPNDPGKEPPVHVVLDEMMPDEGELIDLLELLKARGADLHASGRESSTRGQSPLHVAARKELLAVAKYLLNCGADPLATDLQGRTPRQAAEAAAEWFKGLYGDKVDGAKSAAMIAFLADAESGRADLDWRADAEAASRRELRRKRVMKVAFGKLGAGFKALGAISGDDPSTQALADASAFGQPDEIHLTPDDSDWPSEAPRSESAALLASEGFAPIGRYAIPEMPMIRLETFHHPRDHLYAAIYDAAGQSIVDLIRYGLDDTKLTVSNNTAIPESQFAMPDERTIRLVGAPLADLLDALRAEPVPTGGVVPIAAGEFVERFEGAYRREMKARMRHLRRQR